MNKRQTEVLQYLENREKRVLKELEEQYRGALEDINMSIQVMLTDEQTPSKVYRIQHQKALRSQIEGIIEKLHGREYETIAEYLRDSYTDSFVGCMYDHAGQGIPLILPIDQNAAAKAIEIDSELSEDLYTSLGVDTQKLKKTIRQEITRGLASTMAFVDISRNVANVAKAPLNRAKTIVKTEAHRIQEAARYDGMLQAKSKGAREVKIWTSLGNSRVRDAHRDLHGQIREVDEPFTYGSKKAMYPGDFGDPALDINCNCKALTKATWLLDEITLKELEDQAAYWKLDKTKDFQEYREKYLYAAERPEEYLRAGALPDDFVDTRKVGKPIAQEDLQRVIEKARLKGVQIGQESNPTGGFETYCGDLDVLYDAIDQVVKQQESDLFMKAGAKKIVLMYDNVLGYYGDSKYIDVGAFAMTQGHTVTLNKFMFDDSAYLKKEYAELAAAGFFPKGTDYTCIIAHEAGHMIGKKNRQLYKDVLRILEGESAKEGIDLKKYIANNISIYAASDQRYYDFHELIPEINSMLNSGKKYGILEVLKKGGVF